jgi:hypothetical protein
MFVSVVILGRFTTETHAMAPHIPDRHAAAIYTTSRDAPRVSASQGERVAPAAGYVLARRDISGGTRVRLKTPNFGDGPMAGIDDLSPALSRPDRQIVRLGAQWRPRPWPDLTRRMLTAPADQRDADAQRTVIGAAVLTLPGVARVRRWFRNGLAGYSVGERNASGGLCPTLRSGVTLPALRSRCY